MAHRLIHVLIAVFLSSLAGSAQVQLSLPVLNEYNITPSAITDVTIQSAVSGQAILVAQLSDGTSADLMLEARSSVFPINQGLTRFRNSGATLSTTYGTSDASKYLYTHHSLPFGNYSLCITLLPVSGIEEQLIECEEFLSEQESFLELVYPANGDTVATLRPPLNWFHTSGFSSGSNDYVLTLCKVETNQTAFSAVAENFPLLSLRSLQSHQVQFPANQPELEPGCHYVWKVEHWYQSTPVLSSEIWEFFTQIKTPDPIIKYVKLTREPRGAAYQCRDKRLYLAFERTYTLNQFSWEITDKRDFSTNSASHENIITSGEIETDATSQVIVDLKSLKLPNGRYYLTISPAPYEAYKLTFDVE